MSTVNGFSGPQLPTELLEYINKNGDASTLLQFSQASQLFHRIGQAEYYSPSDLSAIISRTPKEEVQVLRKFVEKYFKCQVAREDFETEELAGLEVRAKEFFRSLPELPFAVVLSISDEAGERDYRRTNTASFLRMQDSNDPILLNKTIRGYNSGGVMGIRGAPENVENAIFDPCTLRLRASLISEAEGPES